MDCEILPENPRAASHTSRKITLVSLDGEVFEVDEAVALESLRMKYYIDCNWANNGIQLPEVTSRILSKVIEYCKKHVESRKSDDCATGAVDDIKAWDAEFIKVDQATLFDLIRAENSVCSLRLTRRQCCPLNYVAKVSLLVSTADTYLRVSVVMSLESSMELDVSIA